MSQRPVTYRIGGSPEVMALLDVEISNDGSIYLFTLKSPQAREWVEDNVSEPQYFAGRLVVEARYAVDLAQGMLDAGLRLA